MRRALDEFYVRGVVHNLPFLAAVMAHPRFREGRLTTNFIAEEFPGGFAGGAPAAARSGLLAAVAAVVERVRDERRGATQDSRTVMLNRAPVAAHRRRQGTPTSRSRSAAGASPSRPTGSPASRCSTARSTATVVAVQVDAAAPAGA